MRTVEFKNKSYPIKDIQMPFGERTISIVEFDDVLMNEDGSYSSKEARIIDEQIFYFVEKECFPLPEEELVNKIMSEI